MKRKLYSSLFILGLFLLFVFPSCELDLPRHTYTGMGGDINKDANTFTLEVPDRGEFYSIPRLLISGLTFPAASELKISIISPEGTPVTILDQRGGANAFTGDYTFVSKYSGAGIDHLVLWAGDVVPDETYCADEGFDALNKEEISGTWELRIYNYSATETGTIDSWSLEIKYDDSNDSSNIP